MGAPGRWVCRPPSALPVPVLSLPWAPHAEHPEAGPGGQAAGPVLDSQPPGVQGVQCVPDRPLRGLGPVTSVFTHGPGGRAGAGPETHATRRPVFLGPTSACKGTPPVPASPRGVGCHPGVPLSAAPFVLLPVPPKGETVTGRSKEAQRGLRQMSPSPPGPQLPHQKAPSASPGRLTHRGSGGLPVTVGNETRTPSSAAALTARRASACSLEKPPPPGTPR